MRGYTFDAGALIALERHDQFVLGLLRQGLLRRTEIAIPRTAIAQVWRGAGRRSNMARLINAAHVDAATVIVDELSDLRAKQIGVTIGKTSHADITDVHVALVAEERGHAVITSDEGDIAKVNPDLVILHV